MSDAKSTPSNASLTQTLDELRTAIQNQLPQSSLEIMNRATETLIRDGLAEKSLQVGDRVPDFSLPNIHNDPVMLQALRATGPVIISFYRGSWCPYCNAELIALQETLPAIEHLGATLVTISPQQHRYGKKLAIEHGITYEILIDAGNQVAQQFGLVFELPPELETVYETLDIAVREHNAARRAVLPIPATYVVSSQGDIAFAFVNADYTRRLDPVELVTVLRQLQAP